MTLTPCPLFMMDKVDVTLVAFALEPPRLLGWRYNYCERNRYVFLQNGYGLSSSWSSPS